MRHVVDKARATGNDQVLVCERGTSFGYNYLISNMRALAILRETGCPVVFDATHSVQMPSGRGTPPVQSGSSCRYWRGPRWPSGSRGSSWRPTRAPTRP